VKNSPLTELVSKFRSPTTPESFFLSLEGIEGSGKSTQIKAVDDYFQSKGFRTLTLREPGGTVFGEKLREAVLSSSVRLHPLAECHLFLASRAQILEEKILPFLLERPRSVVILDRYIDSTLAYQGKARRMGFETVLTLHQHGPLNLLPHRTFFLDIALETSQKRQLVRGNAKDYFESEKTDFYLNLIDGYREAQRLFPDRIVRVDAERPAEEVTSLILNDLKGLFE
jgi:dTMP kinase